MKTSEFLTFAAKNVIRPGFLKNTINDGKPDSVALTKSNDETGVDTKGSPIGVYYIEQDDKAKDKFAAYVCNYLKGETKYQTLGGEASFCFTTTINGCTFAVGHPAIDGTLLVSHTNKPNTDLDKSIQLQTQETLDLHGSGGFIDPTVYWSGGKIVNGEKINVTVFGVKEKGWKFYYQRWTRNTMTKVNTLLGLNSFETSALDF